MSEAYTRDEVRDAFLKHLWFIVDQWDTAERETTREKIAGAMFSLMNVFDGTQCGWPAMNISLSPHADDKQYCIENDENWHEPGMVFNDDCYLHDLFYPADPRRSP